MCRTPYNSGFIALVISLAASIAWADAMRDEYSVKVAYLYNFARFVNWPDEVFSGNNRFNLCILGENPFGARLQPLENRSIETKQISILSLDVEEAKRSRCHLLFVRDASLYTDFLEQLASEPVLTVTDRKGPTIIEMFTHEDRVKFRIDRERAKRASLLVSAQLMKLSTPE